MRPGSSGFQLSYPTEEPKPVVEVSTSREDSWGRVPFDIKVPVVMMSRKKVGNMQVAQWLAEKLQEWLDAP